MRSLFLLAYSAYALLTLFLATSCEDDNKGGTGFEDPDVFNFFDEHFIHSLPSHTIIDERSNSPKGGIRIIITSGLTTDEIRAHLEAKIAGTEYSVRTYRNDSLQIRKGSETIAVLINDSHSTGEIRITPK